MDPREIKADLYRLTRAMQNAIVERADSEKFADRNAAVLKANTYCYQHVAGWQSVVAANVTAAIRSINKEGPLDARDTAVLMAAVEDWTVGHLAQGGLTEAEFNHCTRRLQPALDELAGLPADANPPVYRAGAANVDKGAGKTSPKKRQAPAKDDSEELRALAAQMVAKEAPAEQTLEVSFDDLFGGDDPVEAVAVETAAGTLPAVDDFELLLESA